MDNIQPPSKFEKVLPGILTGIGIASMISAIFSAVNATPKAFELMDKAEAEKGDILDGGERIKASIPAYIPTLILAAAGTTCIVASDVVQYKNAGTLLTLATTAGQAVTECKALINRQEDEIESYKKAMVDKFGEEAEKLIQTEAAKYSEMQQQPLMLPMKRSSDPDDELFIDTFTGQAFYSTETKVHDVVNMLNSHKLSGDDVTIDDWCDLLGLNSMSIGNRLYWSSTDTKLISIMITEDKYHQYKIVSFSMGCKPRFS